MASATLSPWRLHFCLGFSIHKSYISSCKTVSFVFILNMALRILVLGAGELGTAVLASLSQLAPPSTHISVLLRPASISSPSPSKAIELADLRSWGVSLLPFDLASSSVSSLAAVVQPYDLVVSCLGFGEGLPVGTSLETARAALAAKVKRFVPMAIWG